MSENHYDHEQDEWDHYDREMERLDREHKSCLVSLKMLLVISIIVFILLSVFGCGAKTFSLVPEGIPIQQDGDRVLGVFRSSNSEKETFHAQWFYFPGQGLIDPHEYRIIVILEKKQP